MFASCFRSVFQRRRHQSSTTSRRHARFRPRLEVLEDRALPSTFTVTNLQDSGDGSLRQAIFDANEGEDNTIVFAVTGTISLASTLPDVGADLNIQGPGPDLLTVQRSTADGTPEFSVFTIYNAMVNLSGLTIAKGNATLGGGIFNDGGIVTVSDCILTGNCALRGGGITNFGSLTVSDSTIADNTATSKGGGIANFGPLTVSYTNLTENSASSGGAIYNFDEAVLTISYSTLASNAADFGGGIDINGGTVTVTSSTLTGNSAAIGGGILNSFSGVLTVSNSTLAGNSATTQGGGIDNEGGSLTVSNATISDNAAVQGGGLCNEGTMTCRDSIIAGNTAGDGPDLFGDLGSRGYNLIGNTSGCDGLDPTDLCNVDPLLGPLQDNGGPTWTMALLPGSPAISAGDPADAPAWDQRGPGFDRVVKGRIDIGAFEVQAGGASRPEVPAPARSSLTLAEQALLDSKDVRTMK